MIADTSQGFFPLVETIYLIWFLCLNVTLSCSVFWVRNSMRARKQGGLDFKFVNGGVRAGNSGEEQKVADETGDRGARKLKFCGDCTYRYRRV